MLAYSITDSSAVIFMLCSLVSSAFMEALETGKNKRLSLFHSSQWSLHVIIDAFQLGVIDIIIYAKAKSRFGADKMSIVVSLAISPSSYTQRPFPCINISMWFDHINQLLAVNGAARSLSELSFLL